MDVRTGCSISVMMLADLQIMGQWDLIPNPNNPFHVDIFVAGLAPYGVIKVMCARGLIVTQVTVYFVVICLYSPGSY